MNAVTRSELRLIARDRTLWITLLVLAGCIAFATASGLRYRTEWNDAAAEMSRKSADRLAAQRAVLRAEQPARRGEPPPGTPNSVQIATPAAVPPLAQLAVGQSDLYPRSADVMIYSRLDSLFARYQIQSPITLASGRFDAAYVVVAVLPLLVIVLCFDLLASDRVSGRLSLLAVQAGGLRKLVLRRLALRGGVLLLPLLLLLTIGLASGAPLVPLLIWIGIASLYALFWLLLCGWIAVRRARPEAQAAQLVAIWLLLVLAVPAGVNRLVDVIAPPPSRQLFETAIRDAQNHAGRRAEELLQGYLSDHPELTTTGDEQYAGWLRRMVVVQKTVEAETEPIARAYDAQLERARRASAILQFLSPAAAVQVALSDAAGTGPAQHAAYVDAVRAFKNDLQRSLIPHLYRATLLSADDLAALPTFTAPRWVPARGGGLLALTAFVLGVLCLLLGWRLVIATSAASSEVTSTTYRETP